MTHATPGVTTSTAHTDQAPGRTGDTGATGPVHGQDEIRAAVRDRYARAATEAGGCCAPSCCGDTADASEAGATTATATARAVGYSDEELATLPDDANLGLGCGNPSAIADLEPGQTVLDLGSGAGIDCFLASRQVGPTGRVIGVDMTPEMVERARRNAREGGYENVEFRLGEIEALPVADASVDVIISNCVLNLSPERPRALAEAHRVLRSGGRIVISDMVSEHRVPDVVAGSLDAVAGCLPTPRSRYVQEFEEAGFDGVRISDERPYPASYLLEDPGVRAFLADHPEAEAQVAEFAASIAGAVITGTKA